MSIQLTNHMLDSFVNGSGSQIWTSLLQQNLIQEVHHLPNWITANQDEIQGNEHSTKIYRNV
jgi:hypothetical protein